MKKILVHIEMNLPLSPEEIGIANIRKIGRDIRYAQGCSVVLWFLCDDAQAKAVESVTGFVWPSQYNEYQPALPNEIGATENFRFLRKEQRVGVADRRKA